MQIQQFVQFTEIGGRQSAIHEVDRHAGPGVEHFPRVPSARCARELDGRHSVSLPPQTDDQAHRGVGFSRIHRRAANHNDANDRPGCFARGWESEPPQPKPAALRISHEAEQVQLGWLARLRVLALNHAAQPCHAEQITTFPVRSRIALKLQRRITVSEDHRKRIALVQGATAAVREFKSRVPSDPLHSGQADVPRLGSI